MRPQLTPLVQSLPDTVPFIGPEAIERQLGVRLRARLGANESGFGPSPKVIAAMAAAAPEAWKYGDPEVFELRQALAEHLGVPAANLAVGEGIDGLFGLIARLFLSPGDAVVTSLGAYPTFNFHAIGHGARLVTVPFAGDREDPEALLDAARRERAKLVYFCNPSNPMGTWWPAAQVQALIDAVPDEALLVLDEAYGETAPEGTLPSLDVSRPNVLRLRTFSKAYGLAGQRVGYAIGEAANVRAFDKVRNHFGVTRLGQVGALAALGDQGYLSQVIAQVGRARQRIGAIAMANGLAPIASATNFVAIDCGRDGAFALRVLRGLEARGVFVRKPMAPRLDRCIRVSSGPDAELDVFAEALQVALAGA
ncbi:MAG: Histidinol-phosphate aminotransferase e [Devosia sp.]|nr:Histidinol-phosphate aminotransferase e [Devosia sp.]